MCTVVAKREVVDAEVGRELLARRVAGRRHDAVDVGGDEPRVGDRGVGRLQHQLDGKVRRAAHVVGLTDADDGGSPAKPGMRAGRYCAGNAASPIASAPAVPGSPWCAASPNGSTRPSVVSTQ